METSKHSLLPRLALYRHWYSLLLYVNERGRRLLEMGEEGKTAGDLGRPPELPLRLDCLQRKFYAIPCDSMERYGRIRKEFTPQRLTLCFSARTRYHASSQGEKT